MSTESDSLLTKATSYFLKVRNRLTPIVYNEIDIAANATSTIDVTASLPDLTKYDLRSSSVSIRLKDTTTGNPTSGMYLSVANSDVVTAIDNAGKLLVINKTAAAIKVLLVVGYPTIKK